MRAAGFALVCLSSVAASGCAQLQAWNEAAMRESTPEWACEHGDAQACDWLGWAVHKGQHTSTMPAVHWFALSCGLGDQLASNNAGWHHHKGLSGPVYDDQATVFFRRACPDDTKDDGDISEGAAYGCGNLGYQYENGLGVARDYERAVVAYAKSCAAKMSASCFSLGIGYERGRGIERDVVKARALYEFARSNGSKLGCTNLANMLLDGLGGPFDLPRAHALMTSRCDEGDPWSCTNLGYAYANAVGVAKDACRARALHERACAVDNHALGCANLGASLLSSACAPKDPARGRPLVEAGCRDHAYACGTLGAELRAQGDKAGALAALRRGCEHDDSHACLVLGQALRDGHGVTKDASAALVALRASCARGRPDGCREAAQLASKLGDASAGDLQARACALGAGDRC